LLYVAQRVVQDWDHSLNPSHGTDLLKAARAAINRATKEEAMSANASLIAAAPELDAYRRYVEDDMVRRGGWTTLRFDEFRDSEECAYYMKEEVR
jgi:hypothetical protein